jgi:hypothetical protein
MQFADFFNAGSGLLDTAKIVLFRMLPRGAQIDKVRAEINRSLLKKYGRLTRLEIDRQNKIIRAELSLQGEKELVWITAANYRLSAEAGQNPVSEPGTIEVSRTWLDALLKTLVKTGAVPGRMEIKNPLHQAVVKSLL